jgi:hypothetical protein
VPNIFRSLRDRIDAEPRSEKGRARRDKRRARQALDARVKAEYLDTFNRDVGGLGRVDPDRRR